MKSHIGPINSTIGRLLWAIQAWCAEMENDERSEAIRAGYARARASGNSQIHRSGACKAQIMIPGENSPSVQQPVSWTEGGISTGN
jgi:hypothetical protein